MRALSDLFSAQPGAIRQICSARRRAEECRFIEGCGAPKVAVEAVLGPEAVLRTRACQGNLYMMIACPGTVQGRYL